MSSARAWSALFWSGTAERRVVCCGLELMARVCLRGHGLVVAVVGLRGRVEGGRRGCSACRIFCNCFFLFGRFLVAGEGNIGGCFEELFPEFGAFPDVLGVFCILLDDWQDTSSNDAMSATEVVVDLYVESIAVGPL